MTLFRERFEGQTNIELPTFPGKARLKQLIKSRVRQEDLAEELKLEYVQVQRALKITIGDCTRPQKYAYGFWWAWF